MVTRGAAVFEVVDDPQTASWGFWQDHFATGRWEPFTLQTIDAFVGPSSTYVDIGSWVGPTVLWAARNAGQVVAVDRVEVRGLRQAAGDRIALAAGRRRRVVVEVRLRHAQRRPPPGPCST